MVGGRGFRTGSAAALAVAMLVCLGSRPAAAQTAPPAPALADLLGESCRTAPRTDIAADPAAPPPLYISCGAAKNRPDGSVGAIPVPLGLPADAAARRDILRRAAEGSAMGLDESLRMICRPGAWSATADKLDMLIRPCALRDGAWPNIVVVAVLGRYLVVGDGLPAMLPAIESAMAALAGYQAPAGAPPFGGADAARKALEAALGGSDHLVGSDDHARFAALAEAARLDESRRDYRAAEDAHRETLTIEERAFGAEAPGLGGVLLDLALDVSNQGRFDEAARLFHRADPIIAKSANPADQARFFTYQAYDAANAARYNDALAYGRRASEIYRDLASGAATSAEDVLGGESARSASRGELAHALNLEAAMALRMGDSAGAEADAKEALEIIGEEDGLPPWWRPEILETIGEIYAREGRYAEADESFRGALIYRQRLFGGTAPTAFTLLALARVYADEGLADQSVRGFDLALKIFEGDEIARSQLTFDQIAPLLAAGSEAARRHPERRAELEQKMFGALQLMAASVADQTIARASLRLAAADPAMGKLVADLHEAERRRDEARIALGYQTSLPDDQRGARGEAALLAEIKKQSALYLAAQQELQAKYPDYGRLADPPPATLAELQKHLRAGEAFLMFEIGRERSFAVLIRPDRFVAKPLPIGRAGLDESVRALRRAFVPGAVGIGDFDLAGAHKLYASLFGPIEADLAGVDKIIVVSGGALSSLPVGLLVTAPPAGAKDYAAAAWLVRRFATSEVPSVRAFLSLRDRPPSHAARPFLGLGAPTFEGKPGADKDPNTGLGALDVECREAGPIPAAMLRALPPLPETEGEVRSVAKALGAGPDSLLIGAQASEANLRKQPLGDYRVLYFATHGLLPGELACQSEPALALSPPARPAASRDEDGLLDASEIAELKLGADLVVLSACNTAQPGQRFGGEALGGLAESFFYAGARTLVASHWQVPSKATAGLMVGLFADLAGDPEGGVAGSLRKAQLALIAKPATAHPFYWAAFTVIGDGDSALPLGAKASR